MNNSQMDMFSGDKTIDEVQLEKAIEVVIDAGFFVVKNREDAKKIAMSYGFRVTEPLIVNSEIKNYRDIRNYFFARLWENHPEIKSNYISGNWKSEYRAIRLFVESREATGLNTYNAIQECVAIIDAIFDNEDQFHFNRQVGVWILGQGKAGWITDKAVSLVNMTREKRIKEDLEKKFELMEDAYEKEMDLKETSNKLDRMLNNLEDGNGKEEEGGK